MSSMHLVHGSCEISRLQIWLLLGSVTTSRWYPRTAMAKTRMSSASSSGSLCASLAVDSEELDVCFVRVGCQMAAVVGAARRTCTYVVVPLEDVLQSDADEYVGFVRHHAECAEHGEG